ncbi:alpha-(1,3)-fucosyltransferase 7-like [Branchiostoma floridae]|uniref:Fucosyltransferase n=1 Tax=Branchiostoma floridae TaxID=7739 RepID=A0A9J7MK81_BRAFL|nr:alpha-(1,3)-fucosyltransferase 7-like [Branchiostoma floridae]
MARGKLADLLFLVCLLIGVISVVQFIFIPKMQSSTEDVHRYRGRWFDTEKTGKVPFGPIKTLNTSDLDTRSSAVGFAYPASEFFTVWHEDSVPRVNGKLREKKKIVVWGDGEEWDETISSPCRPDVPPCDITLDTGQSEGADAVVFYYSRTPNVFNSRSMPKRYPHQYWIFFSDEAPLYPAMRAHDFASYNGVFNMTMTYRLDSDVPALYGSTAIVHNKLNGKDRRHSEEDYSVGKKGLAVWFVSNCYKYLPRFAFAKELLKHMDLDIFGKCGKDIVCPEKGYDCSDSIIKQYKFYLAFESYHCREYITEKFWRNALENEAVPIVLGPPKCDYEQIAPPNSFIHVDDFESPEDLAAYLKRLDKDKELYNQYLKWRALPIPTESIFSDFGSAWCRLCKKLHDVDTTERKVYTDIDGWLKGKNNEKCEPVIFLDYTDPRNNVRFGYNFTPL